MDHRGKRKIGSSARAMEITTGEYRANAGSLSGGTSLLADFPAEGLLPNLEKRPWRRVAIAATHEVYQMTDVSQLSTGRVGRRRNSAPQPRPGRAEGHLE
jgi:hypothetical protein